jgi:hypothetical protein
MNRREAILRTAGFMLYVPIMGGLLESCQNGTDKAVRQPSNVITELHKKMIAEIADLIIPTTDTPGAKAAEVPEFILIIVGECYDQKEQERFVAGLDTLNDRTKEKYGKAFLECDPKDQTEILLTLEKEARAEWEKDNTVPTPFISQIKQLTSVGYFTSEIGATKALNYKAIPAGYKGCVPLEPGQKAWAT